MQKRGQFYLLAVIIIIAIIASVATIYNQVQTKPSDEFHYDLSKEIEFESSKVLDRGVFFAESEDTLKAQIKNITDYYAYSNPRQDLIIVYGNEQNIHFFYYNQTQSGSVGFSFGGTNVVTQPVSTIHFQSATQVRNESTITINITSDVSHTFNLRKGQFLFVVLKEEKDGERYISIPR